MDPDFIPRPLDILIGYDRTLGNIAKPRKAGQERKVGWVPSDIHPKQKDEAAYWFRRAASAARNKLNGPWRRAAAAEGRAEDERKDHGYAKRSVRRKVKEGTIDMAQFDAPDHGRAEEALATLVKVMRTPEENGKTKVAAAKTLLDFTKTKPVVKTEVTVKSAEAFLDEIDDD